MSQTTVAVFPGASMALPEDLPSEDTRADELTLVARARRQDGEAFGALFDLHAQAVFRFLADLTGDSSAADEGTQETFVRAYDRIATLQEEDRLLPWLLGIARNVSFELRRAQRRVVSLVGEGDEAPEVEQLTDALTPEATLLSREDLACVGAALSRLSEGRRAALLLRFDHGLPYEEIAKVLGWGLSKAKVEVHRARLQLRAALVQSEEGGGEA